MYRPEVGEWCWAQWTHGGPDEKVIITYMSDEVGCYKKEVYGELKEFTFATNTIKFRPLKSKRDEEIEEMMRVTARAERIGEDIAERHASALHKAGFRKQIPYAEFVSTIQYCLENECHILNPSSNRFAKIIAAKLNRTPDEG